MILDLFSGIGGFSVGLEKVGFKTIAFCEKDTYCQEVLKTHWKNIKIYGDVKEITKERFEADGFELPDIITGGFPCQPFSVAGLQAGTSDDRYLWPEMFRIIKEFKPRWIIAENVRGIINIQDGLAFERVCTDLESEGYEVQPFNIPAAGVGAPHKRERIWFVAHTNSDDGRSRSSSESQKGETRMEHRSSSKRQYEQKSSEDVAHTERTGPQGYREEHRLRQSSEEIQTSRNGWWSVEPNVGRVAHGVQGRIHRLKGLGNAIVPQIAEEIGKAILKAGYDKV